MTLLTVTIEPQESFTGHPFLRVTVKEGDTVRHHFDHEPNANLPADLSANERIAVERAILEASS